MKCKTVKFLYNAIPLNSFRSYLITTHFSSCSCSTELADESKIGAVIMRPENVPEKIDVWPGLKENILAYERENRLKARKITGGMKRWQLGLTGAVTLLIIILIPFIFNRGKGQDLDKPGIENREIVVKTLMIENRPAKSFYFQSKDTNKTILWVQKTKS